MWLALAGVSLLAPYAASIVFVASIRRRNLALCAAVGLAVLIGVEALVLQALSAFGAVHRWPLVAANLLLVVVSVIVQPLAWRDLGLRLRRVRFRRGPLPGAVLGLGTLALVSALAYRPNNYDSMTYHLARVAHWMQHGSVAKFATSIGRQVGNPPGAEYLLLVLQTVSVSERLANLLQWSAWCLMVAAARPLARQFGAPARVARWATLLVATLPMGLLQASSTQNDLVAAGVAIALVVSVHPFLHRTARWRRGDLVLLTFAVAAGFLVKPTSLLAGAPLLLYGALAVLRRMDARQLSALLRDASPALAVAVVLAVVVQHATPSGSYSQKMSPNSFIYSRFEPGDRAVAALRALARELAIQAPVLDRLAPPWTAGCPRPDSLCLEAGLKIHEDYVAGSLQMATVLVLVAVGAMRWRTLGGIAKMAIPGVVLAWIALGGGLRDNVWNTRLHLPFFAITPLALSALQGARTRRWTYGIAVAASLTAVGVGIVVLTQNVLRPLQMTSLARGQSAGTYYFEAPEGLALRHARTLSALRRSGCRRLGLFLGGNSVDYPLTWRAMQLGIEVRHVDGADTWPCVIFADRGPLPLRADGMPWRAGSVEGLFLAP